MADESKRYTRVSTLLSHMNLARACNSLTIRAGSIGSPAILMRSGIGPSSELELFGIRSTIDLPGVGARLWDHAAVPIRLVPHPGEPTCAHEP